MEAAASPPIAFRRASGASVHALAWRTANGAVWGASFLLVLYLALKNGGFDIVERSEVGIAVWWIVVVGTVVGAFAPGGESRTGRILLLVLALFAGWNALSLGWTESAGRTSIELGKVTAYLGFFAFALAVQGSGRWRSVLYGVTAAIGAVTVLAVMSRMVPSWFPAQEATRFSPQLQDRLLYPLNYSTGLAALMTMGVPLLLNATASARTLTSQALAAAALPMAGLGLWLTGSSLALPLLIVAAGAYLVLTHDRLPKLATTIVAAIGGAILIAAESQRDALDRGLTTATAEHQGHELLAIAIAVCAGVAALQLGISVMDRSWRRPSWLTPTPRVTAALAGGAVIVAIVIAIGAGAPGWVSDKWDQFANGSGSQSSSTRAGAITDLSSAGRYAFWQSADDAFSSKPWTGIGPGTFEFWWTQHGSRDGVVTDAHSLPRETLAELGIPGFILLMGFCVGVVAIGAVRAFRVPLRMRDDIAAATAASLAFLAAVTVDWSWELGVIPAAFMLVGAVAVAGGGEPDPARRRHRPRGLWRFAPVAGRVAVVGAGVACLIAIALPLTSARDLSESQDAAARGDLSEALSKAQDAASAEPYAAMPKLQEALVLERQGNLEGALGAAESAEAKESTNWQIPLIVSRLEARLGNADAAVAAYRRAHSLAPRLPILAKPEPAS